MTRKKLIFPMVAVLMAFMLVLLAGACSSPKPSAPKTPAPETKAPAVETPAAPAEADAVEVPAEPAEADAVEAPAEPVDADAVAISAKAMDAAVAEAPAEPEAVEAPPEIEWNKEIVETPAGETAVQEADDPAVAAALAPQIRPYAESSYAKNIDAGLVFMAMNVGKEPCGWMDYLVLDYLQRKFGLDEWFRAANNVDPEKLNAEDRANYLLHARMALAGHRLEDAGIRYEDSFLFTGYTPEDGGELVNVAALKHVGLPVSRLMLRALYCDVEPVDAEYIAEVVQQATTSTYTGAPNNFGGYMVAHMALVCQWLRDLGCAEAFEELAALDETLADMLVEIVEDQKVLTDLALESMALLHYIGHPDKVKKEWLEQVAQAQLESGAWDRQGGGGAAVVPQCHTAAFALWVLLEDALPDAPEVPWVR